MRIQFLDNVKILASLLVIFAHLYSTYSPQRLYIYAFHMPLFFIISGVLHKYDGTIQLRKYTKKLVLPIIVFFVFFSIFYIPFEFYMHRLSGLGVITNAWGGGNLLYVIILYMTNNIKGLILGNDCSNVVLWFLYALLWCKIILDVKKLLCRTTMREVIFWIIIFFGIIKRPSYFYIGQAFMAFPFYYLGYNSKKVIMRIENKKYSNFIIPIAILSVLITLFNGRVSMSGLSYGSHSILISIPLFYFNAILGCIALLLISARLPSINIDNSANSLITVLGIQMIFVIIYKHILGDNANILISLIFTCIIFFICHLLHKFIFSRILK